MDKRTNALERLQRENADLRGAMLADDARLRDAGMRVGLFFGCDTPDVMATTIERLQRENEIMGKTIESHGHEVVRLRRENAHCEKNMLNAISEKSRLQEHLTACNSANVRICTENAELHADAERLNYLESLMHRRQFQNEKRPTERVGSDLHMGDGSAALYIRDLFGNVANRGHGDTVRDAIDAAMKEPK
jgi:hypothetical protein